MKKTLDIIAWFWSEHARIGEFSHTDGFCQCETEILIKKSADPDSMRAFLLVGVFVDQLFHSHHKNLYEKFSKNFKFPKNYRCQTNGMANANWFIYSYHGYDKKINWDKFAEVSEIVLSDTINWMRQRDEKFDENGWIYDHLYPEINHVFEPKNAKLLKGNISKFLHYSGNQS